MCLGYLTGYHHMCRGCLIDVFRNNFVLEIYSITFFLKTSMRYYQNALFWTAHYTHIYSLGVDGEPCIISTSINTLDKKKLDIPDNAQRLTGY